MKKINKIKKKIRNFLRQLYKKINEDSSESLILKIFESVVEGRLYTRGSKRRYRGSYLSSNHKLGFRNLRLEEDRYKDVK